MSAMAIDPEEYRRQSRETWGELATPWTERREWFMEVTGPVNDRLVDRAAPEPGQTFLELAAGTGDLGFQVAERVGDGGRVLVTDFAPEMVEAARRFGEGRSNVDYRVLDAEQMDLEDDSVDGVVCRWAYMLMSDPAGAFRETRRVLREGGPLSFAVWAGPDRNPWAAIPGMVLVQRGHMPPPEPGAPGIFAMGDPERIRELVTAGGFGEPDVELIEFVFPSADFETMWDNIARMSPLARVLGELPDDEQQAAREAVREAVAPFRSEDGSYAAPAATWVALAR
jgi:SAM-dependent methyltransferase